MSRPEFALPFAISCFAFALSVLFNSDKSDNLPYWLPWQVVMVALVSLGIGSLGWSILTALSKIRSSRNIYDNPFKASALSNDFMRLSADEIDNQTASSLAKQLDAIANNTLAGNRKAACLSEEMMHNLIIHSPQSLIAIKEKGSLTGFALISGLNTEITESILENRVLNGHQIPLSNICRDFSRASSLYVFGVYAIGAKARAAILQTVILDLHQHLVCNPKQLKYVFSRPGTVHGKRILKKLNFHFPKIGVCKAHRSELLLQLGAWIVGHSK